MRLPFIQPELLVSDVRETAVLLPLVSLLSLLSLHRRSDDDASELSADLHEYLQTIMDVVYSEDDEEANEFDHDGDYHGDENSS